MNEAKRPAAGGMIIRRACPGCGAPIRHAEGDGAAACGHCGLAFAIASCSDPCPAFLVPPRAPADDGLLVEAKRALRLGRVRLRSLSAPRLLFAPFYRMLADTWLCYRVPAPVPASQEISPGLPTELPPGEVRFQVGTRDLSLDAGPATGAWRRSLGLRAQTCEATPLSGSAGTEALPVRVPQAEARARLLAQLESTGQREGVDDEQRLFAPEVRLTLLFWPAYLVPFHDGEESRGVILDGLSGRAEAILSAADHRELFALLAPLPEEDSASPLEGARRPDGSPDGAHRDGIERQAPPLLPLLCPECSAPMPLHPRARLHGCPVCLRLWSPANGRLQPEPMRLLRPSPARRRRDDSVLGPRRAWLPFHRLRGGTETLFAPAFQGRHPRAVWNFTLALNRRKPEWHEEAEEGCRPGAVVERTAGSALALAPFLSFCLERARPFSPAEAELVWIEFAPRGPDWVEPGLGLGFPRAAVTPWAPPVPQATAGRTG